jgi:hypothetical protein
MFTASIQRDPTHRYLLLLHHDHGCQQCGLHNHDPQLSPQAGQHTQHVSIMIMVASNVVCTIMILNYHHRLANTHSM